MRQFRKSGFSMGLLESPWGGSQPPAIKQPHREIVVGSRDARNI
jgi:hypothetical protein